MVQGTESDLVVALLVMLAFALGAGAGAGPRAGKIDQILHLLKKLVEQNNTGHDG